MKRETAYSAPMVSARVPVPRAVDPRTSWNPRNRARHALYDDMRRADGRPLVLGSPFPRPDSAPIQRADSTGRNRARAEPCAILRRAVPYPLLPTYPRNGAHGKPRTVPPAVNGTRDGTGTALACANKPIVAAATISVLACASNQTLAAASTPEPRRRRITETTAVRNFLALNENTNTRSG